MPNTIYVASSWRNEYQPIVCGVLIAEGFDVYDFRNPRPDNHGFHWSQIDPEWQSWTVDEYCNGLKHPLAEEGFKIDMDGLKSCRALVLVLPCGRSAHLEAGFAAGRGMPVIVYCPEKIEPELMYKMTEGITATLDGVIRELSVYGVQPIKWKGE